MIGWSNFFPAGNELRYLTEAFDSGWVSGGAYVEKFETELNKVFAESTSLTVANGTLALQLAFQTLGLKTGDQVIIPSFCFQAAGNVLRQLGAVPIFCDVDPLTWNQSLTTIKETFTNEIVGIVIVHNYGYAAPIKQICEWAKEQGVWVIEDCAEAWFSKDNGNYVGQYGDIGTFSTHATKTISCGEGGVVLINDKKLVDKARLLRSHGLNRNKKSYFHDLAGNNYRLSNLLCAIGYAQLENREKILYKQKNASDLYLKHLKNHWAIDNQISIKSSDNHVWAVATIIKFYLLNITRDDLINLLLLDGIEVRPGFYPASSLSYHDKRDIRSAVSDRISKNIIVLPCSKNLDSTHVNNICSKLISLIDKNRKKQFEVKKVHNSSGGEILVKNFYSALGSGKRNFRYFEKRKYNIIKSHLCTIIIELENEAIGYGHLECFGGTTWLGIAVLDEVIGQGWGKLIMEEILREARLLNITEISLRVDQDNIAAQQLYCSYGFLEKVNSLKNNSIMMCYKLSQRRL